jgi:probable HAF family extracellular repeat protein
MHVDRLSTSAFIKDLPGSGTYLTRDPNGCKPEAGSSYADTRGINASGQIVGYYQDADGTFHGFLATPTPEPSTLLLLLALPRTD